MANEPNATPPAVDPPAGELKIRTRRGYNVVDGDLKINDGEVVSVSAEQAKKLLIKYPDYLTVVKEEKE